MIRSFLRYGTPALLLSMMALPVWAGELVMVAGIPLDFVLFALTLLGVALFHNHTLYVGLTGMATITLYKLVFTGFKTGEGFAGLAGHFGHEWVILANLLCLLMGFALLSRHFEVFLFEDLPATDQRPDQLYLDRVEQCGFLFRFSA